MPRRSPAPVPAAPNPSRKERELLTLGLLAEATTCPRGEVSVDSLEKQLRSRGLQVETEQLKDELDGIIERHCWFGLAWIDPDRTRLATIAGVRWFCQSTMYEQLGVTKPKCRRLTDLFADLVSDLERRYTNPRLLVDAGATTFHCLFHERCQKLRRKTKSVLTNNLFVALRWQEEFNDQGKVHLMGGVPNLDMAATVDNEKLNQWLRAKSRRPDVALLSWHFVKPEDNGSVAFWTKGNRELALKNAAMELTEGTVYVVWGREKITTEVPKGGKSYPIERLLSIQKSPKNRDREVYLLTNVKDPSPAERKVVDCLTSPELSEHRVWFISPYRSTHPEHK